MIDHNKVKLIVNYILIVAIVAVFSGLFYSIGEKRGIASRSRPITVKYSDLTTKNITANFKNAGIGATPAQIETFGMGVKEHGKRAK